MSFPRWLRPAGVLLAGWMLAGCAEEAEERGRAVAEKLRQSIPDVQATARAQPGTPEQVREAQAALARLKEYQGERHGELDDVTIHAIQAFQRRAGLRDHGLLDERTLRALRDAVVD